MYINLLLTFPEAEKAKLRIAASGQSLLDGRKRARQGRSKQSHPPLGHPVPPTEVELSQPPHLLNFPPLNTVTMVMKSQD